ncbi:MAG: hypothetical protein KC586_01805, partial [Myxococcales bacterium]|nr:hypothetical protein [Myxococcales bacterium]
AASVPQPLLPFVKAGPRDHEVLDALARGATDSALPSHKDYRRDGVTDGSVEGDGLWSIAASTPASPPARRPRRAGGTR